MGLVNIDVGGLAKGVTDLLQAKIPTPLDKTKELELKTDLEKMMLTTIAQSDQAQAQINLEDSKSTSFFRSGWRPFCGWLCVFGLAWSTIIKTAIEWISIIAGKTVVLPNIDAGILVSLLVGMLGLGGLRTAEKFKGIS